jgi:hypothetical protein
MSAGKAIAELIDERTLPSIPDDFKDREAFWKQQICNMLASFTRDEDGNWSGLSYINGKWTNVELNNSQSQELEMLSRLTGYVRRVNPQSQSSVGKMGQAMALLQKSQQQFAQQQLGLHAGGKHGKQLLDAIEKAVKKAK